jgi:hypothetical protein
MTWIIVAVLIAIWYWYSSTAPAKAEKFQNTRLSKAQWANMLQPAIENSRMTVPFYQPVY